MVPQSPAMATLCIHPFKWREPSSLKDSAMVFLISHVYLGSRLPYSAGHGIQSVQRSVICGRPNAQKFPGCRENGWSVLCQERKCLVQRSDDSLPALAFVGKNHRGTADVVGRTTTEIKTSTHPPEDRWLVLLHRDFTHLAVRYRTAPIRVHG
jgi:hypothetical protein